MLETIVILVLVFMFLGTILSLLKLILLPITKAIVFIAETTTNIVVSSTVSFCTGMFYLMVFSTIISLPSLLYWSI